VYGGSGVIGIESGSNDNESSGVDGGDCCLESIDSVSDSLPDLYSELNIFLYKS